jgi:hypothetical protein
MHDHDISVEVREARVRLTAWHDVAQWLDYGADEFVADATTAGYLHHVGQCVREEGERRYADAALLAAV